MKKRVLILVIVLPALIIGAVYILYKNNQTTRLGGDRDSHDCIISAGYSWCENKQKCLRPWEEACETSTSSITLVSPNGGEKLYKGGKYSIKWTSKNIQNYKIGIHIRRVPPPELQTEGQEFDPIIFTNLENNGSVEWNVSEMYPPGNYVLEIVAYPSVPITTSVSDESDATFRIISNSK